MEPTREVHLTVFDRNGEVWFKSEGRYCKVDDDDFILTQLKSAVEAVKTINYLQDVVQHLREMLDDNR